MLPHGTSTSRCEWPVMANPQIRASQLPPVLRFSVLHTKWFPTSHVLSKDYLYREEYQPTESEDEEQAEDQEQDDGKLGADNSPAKRVRRDDTQLQNELS